MIDGAGSCRVRTPAINNILVLYGVPIRIGEAFDEAFEPGSLTVNGLLVDVPPPVPGPRGRPLARPGKDLDLRDGPGAMRPTLMLAGTIDGRQGRVGAGELTAFCTSFQAREEEWPAPPALDSEPGVRRIARRARLAGLVLAGRPEHQGPLVTEAGGGHPCRVTGERGSTPEKPEERRIMPFVTVVALTDPESGCAVHGVVEGRRAWALAR